MATFRGFILILGLAFTGLGLLFYIFRESAGEDEPAHYWFWFQGREPYIRDADARVAHVKFKAKALMALGIPEIILSLSLPDPIMNVIDGLILGVGLLMVLVPYLLFISDAVDKDQQARIATEGLTPGEADLIKQLEEKGKLEED